ncbi:MAG TPA: 3-phosphoglycerate dehydrogenase, partial [Eubacteriales bacterium]|nr:3-phosphoglycerate dehydrogenase [Eubacteriales bacterium]
VMNPPGANANAVKELVIASMFLASRNLKRAMNWVDSLKGTEGVAAAVEKNKSAFVGPELMGKTLGLIGLGAIGRAVAAAATALGMRVIGFDPYLAPQMLSALPSSAQCVGCMDELFSTCDYISLHAPLTPDTKYCVCEGAIAKMKKGVILINCARGELVDNAALIAAVKEGKIAAYVTDFPTEELLGIDNVIAIPHLGASTPEAEDNCAVMAAAQIKDYLENGNIVNSVYLPNLKKARTKARRMVALGTVDVSKIFPVVDCDVASASANGYYYSICDFSGEPGKVCSLPEGVMFVREV